MKPAFCLPALLFFGAVVLTGCSSSPSPGTISAPIKGKTFAVNDAVTLGGEIVLTSANDICVPPAQQVEHPYETALLLVVSDNQGNASHVPTMPGTYTVTSSATAHEAVVEANILDGMCLNDADNPVLGTSGSVQLISVDGGTFSGTFDVQLDSGDHITGSFDAPTCNQPRNLQPACQP